MLKNGVWVRHKLSNTSHYITQASEGPGQGSCELEVVSDAFYSVDWTFFEAQWVTFLCPPFPQLSWCSLSHLSSQLKSPGLYGVFPLPPHPTLLSHSSLTLITGSKELSFQGTSKPWGVQHFQYVFFSANSEWSSVNSIRSFAKRPFPLKKWKQKGAHGPQL